LSQSKSHHQARALLRAEEILALAKHTQLLFVHGFVPDLAHKVRYCDPLEFAQA
jgi:type IV secretory pathway TraG/TraD family ATPase VirD4